MNHILLLIALLILNLSADAAAQEFTDASRDSTTRYGTLLPRLTIPQDGDPVNPEEPTTVGSTLLPQENSDSYTCYERIVLGIVYGGLGLTILMSIAQALDPEYIHIYG